jgi:hypothetical protein
LQLTTTYEVNQNTVFNTKFQVLQDSTWPSSEELGLNESQYEAYKLALTHEFAVIQGPPGTGKTYIGVKIAETILRNLKSSGACTMLIICYTNHALDQFLEHILKVTKSIVRIGSQSKNPAMEEISLNNLRKQKTVRKSAANNLFYAERHNLGMIMAELRTAQMNIESLNSGILSYESIRDYIADVGLLTRYYDDDAGDVIKQWLFSQMPLRQVDPKLLDADGVNAEDHAADSDDEDHARTAFNFDDDLVEGRDINGINVKTSFMLCDEVSKLNQLISCYKKSNNRQRDKFNLLIDIREINSRIILFRVSKTYFSLFEFRFVSFRLFLSYLKAINYHSYLHQKSNFIYVMINTYLQIYQAVASSILS